MSSDSDSDDDDDDEEEEDEGNSGDNAAAAASKKGKGKGAAAASSKRKKPSAARNRGDKPQKRSRFIDDIAAVNEDEDDESEDEEGGVRGLIADDDEAAEAEADAGAAAARAQARALKQRDEELTAEQLEAMVRERYGGGSRRGEGGAGASDEDGGRELGHHLRRAAAGVAGAAAQQARLPTHEDPKLWLLETRGGQEREAVVNLMQKAADHEARGLPPLGVSAAFAQDHLRGYFYVEAHKEAHVLEAVRGMRAVLFSKKPKLVPLREMTDALAAARPAASPLREGGWARVRAGAYKGDLCRVVELELSSGRVKVKLVPRLDYAVLSARHNGTAAPASRGATAGKMRPPPRAFSAAEAKDHRLIVDKRRNPRAGASGAEFFLDGLGPFVDGYLLKDVSIRGLLPVDGVPPLDEVQKFAAVGQAAADAAAAEEDEEDYGHDDDDAAAAGGDGGAVGAVEGRHARQRRFAASAAAELAALLKPGGENGRDGNGGGGAASATAAAAASNFVKGDKVEVTEGDLQGLFGRVLGTAPDGLRVLVKPTGEFEDIEPQPVEASALRKRFEAGDHVKVLRGAAAGTTGLVVRVDGPVLAMLSDAGREEVRVFSADVAESAEVASGLDACGEWELHDFVALDGATVGVIVGLDASAVRVLTSAPGSAAGEPDVRSCRSADLKRKLNARQGASTSDRRGAAVSAGDLVALDFDGDRAASAAARYSGKSATVKLVHRQHLFVHCREVAENGGFLCVRGRQVVLKSGAGIGGGGGGGGGGHGAGAAAPAPYGRGGMPLPLKSPAPHRFGGGGGGGGAFGGGVLSSPAPHHFGGGASSAATGPGFAPRSAAAPTMGGAGGFANSAGGFGGGAAGGRGGGHSSLVGRRITVAKGHLRGYVGRVLSVTETHARLEMEATTRTVTVALTALRSEDVGTLTAAAPSMPSSSGHASAAGGFPAGLEPGRTPLHHPSAGGATPLWSAGGGGAMGMMGGATPMHSSSYGGGGATPGGAWGNAAAAGSRSPAWGGPAAAAQEPTPVFPPPHGPTPTPLGGGWGATPYGAGGADPAAAAAAASAAATPVGGAWGQGGATAAAASAAAAAAAAAPSAPPPSSAAINYDSWVGGVVVLPGGGLGVVTQAGGAGGASLAVVDAARSPADGGADPGAGRVSLTPGASAASSARWVAAEDVALARPVKGDTVTILRGPHAGAAATLIGLHANDGIVRLDGGAGGGGEGRGDVTVVDVSCLAVRVAF